MVQQLSDQGEQGAWLGLAAKSKQFICAFQARLEVNDLFTDFGDGILLIKFLEIISGDKLGKPNRGRMRVQKIENLNRCLEFLKHKRIQLENIGAEDILDGNERLILGLMYGPSRYLVGSTKGELICF